ncbi:MAG: radical SAM protein [Deltaproteobacteria bacterium]|nr:radical SAM protein [Deltaproteobacteria bacterium]
MPKDGFDQREVAKRRLAGERGFVAPTDAPTRICLGYPSPYAVAMSSLGFQTIFRELGARDDVLVDRAFLPDDRAAIDALKAAREPLVSYATLRRVADFPIVALSFAYELEIGGLIDFLTLSGIPVLSTDRRKGDPIVVIGGPITFSNPIPLSPFADAIVFGEADQAIHGVVAAAQSGESRNAKLGALARVPGVFIPARGLVPPPCLAADDARLPAFASIVTDETELAGMFLIEAERGCHRGCTYCVMRRSTNGGMRLVAPERILGLIPCDARRVGLVGAAVSDHPRICDILRGVVDAGREVSLSSLRADRLNAEFVGLLAKGGHKTLTVASDAASERLRETIQRKIHERHLIRAATLARDAKMTRLKTYMMVGLPGETHDDIDELVRFTRELAKILPVAMGIAPFVAKRNTPLDGAPFEAIDAIEEKLATIRRGLAGIAEVRPTSARWAYVEYRLAQGGPEAGLAAMRAHQAGGSFAAYRSAFDENSIAAPRPLRVVGGRLE